MLADIIMGHIYEGYDGYAISAFSLQHMILLVTALVLSLEEAMRRIINEQFGRNGLVNEQKVPGGDERTGVRSSSTSVTC